MRRYPKIQFDRLKLYFRQPYTIDCPNTKGAITLYQPSIGDIIDIGQTKFYNSVSVLVNNTTSYRLPLWKMGIDWNDISDFELFTSLYQLVDSQISNLLFGDLNLSNFQMYKKIVVQDNKEIEKRSLYNKEKDIEINEQVYQHIHQYFQTVLNINPEQKITHDKIMKEWFITKDERQLNNALEKEKKMVIKNLSLCNQLYLLA